VWLSNWDVAIGLCLDQAGHKYWMEQPSICQHTRDRSVVNPRRSSGRQSPTFIQ
jgi:hypothetical protein